MPRRAQIRHLRCFCEIRHTFGLSQTWDDQATNGLLWCLALRARPRTTVHLHKGCYRGQEAVARVHNLGRPPRRLVFLHLDGSGHVLPERGIAVEADGRVVGALTSVARHHELGLITLAVIKGSAGLDAVCLAAGLSASQNEIVHPYRGLQVRAGCFALLGVLTW
jgi:folate-binding protein YgfZ